MRWIVVIFERNPSSTLPGCLLVIVIVLGLIGSMLESYWKWATNFIITPYHNVNGVLITFGILLILFAFFAFIFSQIGQIILKFVFIAALIVAVTAALIYAGIQLFNWLFQFNQPLVFLNHLS